MSIAGVATASASGSTSSTRTANTSSVCFQPMLPSSATASGENRNWPNDPAAVPAPNAKVRVLLRQQLAESREHDGEARARKAEADQHAGRQVQHSGRGRVGHQRKPGRVDHAPTASARSDP